MSGTRRILIMVVSHALAIQAQWLDFPTAGIPRTADGEPDLTGRTPRTADGKPDFSGLWEPRAGAVTALGESLAPEFLDIGVNREEPLPYQPWALELRKSRQANYGKDDPSARCLPLGLIHMHASLVPRKMLQLPELLVILYERNVDYRQIFIDGRLLPVDPNPSFNGYSTANWNGDTLVVETTGFRDDIWLDAAGNPLTNAAKITERFRRPNYGNLEITVTVDDPKAYTAPWTVELHQTIKLNTDLLEYFCENEKSLSHLVGK
jgi:hypothetical protein